MNAATNAVSGFKIVNSKAAAVTSPAGSKPADSGSDDADLPRLLIVYPKYPHFDP